MCADSSVLCLSPDCLPKSKLRFSRMAKLDRDRHAKFLKKKSFLNPKFYFPIVSIGSSIGLRSLFRLVHCQRKVIQVRSTSLFNLTDCYVSIRLQWSSGWSIAITALLLLSLSSFNLSFWWNSTHSSNLKLKRNNKNAFNWQTRVLTAVHCIGCACMCAHRQRNCSTKLL